MGIAISKNAAIQALREAAGPMAPADMEWMDRVRAFSALIEDGDQPRTHVAFLGTAILAKAVDPRVDPFAIKQKTGPTAYSARSLCHGALVPEAVPLRIDLGVRGREPLNNQPYFREQRVSVDMPVHDKTRPVLHRLVDMLSDLDAIEDAQEARRALAAFVAVRREHAPAHHDPIEIEGDIDPSWLADRIRSFVAVRSEGGRRAQAVAAGLMDVFAGRDRVEAGRINDPDRHLPGDVGVRARDDANAWERVIEVRDKPVSTSDAYAFAGKCLEAGVREAAILSIAGASDPTIAEAIEWSARRGLTLTIFDGWSSFVSQALFWGEEPSPMAAAAVLARVQTRLIQVEASTDAVDEWSALALRAED